MQSWTLILPQKKEGCGLSVATANRWRRWWSMSSVSQKQPSIRHKLDSRVKNCHGCSSTAAKTTTNRPSHIWTGWHLTTSSPSKPPFASTRSSARTAYSSRQWWRWTATRLLSRWLRPSTISSQWASASTAIAGWWWSHWIVASWPVCSSMLGLGRHWKTSVTRSCSMSWSMSSTAWSKSTMHQRHRARMAWFAWSSRMVAAPFCLIGRPWQIGETCKSSALMNVTAAAILPTAWKKLPHSSTRAMNRAGWTSTASMMSTERKLPSTEAALKPSCKTSRARLCKPRSSSRFRGYAPSPSSTDQALVERQWGLVFSGVSARNSGVLGCWSWHLKLPSTSELFSELANCHKFLHRLWSPSSCWLTIQLRGCLKTCATRWTEARQSASSFTSSRCTPTTQQIFTPADSAPVNQATLVHSPARRPSTCHIAWTTKRLRRSTTSSVALPKVQQEQGQPRRPSSGVDSSTLVWSCLVRITYLARLRSFIKEHLASPEMAERHRRMLQYCSLIYQYSRKAIPRGCFLMTSLGLNDITPGAGYEVGELTPVLQDLLLTYTERLEPPIDCCYTGYRPAHALIATEILNQSEASLVSITGQFLEEMLTGGNFASRHLMDLTMHVFTQRTFLSSSEDDESADTDESAQSGTEDFTEPEVHLFSRRRMKRFSPLVMAILESNDGPKQAVQLALTLCQKAEEFDYYDRAFAWQLLARLLAHTFKQNAIPEEASELLDKILSMSNELLVPTKESDCLQTTAGQPTSGFDAALICIEKALRLPIEIHGKPSTPSKMYVSKGHIFKLMLNIQQQNGCSVDDLKKVIPIASEACKAFGEARKLRQSSWYAFNGEIEVNLAVLERLKKSKVFGQDKKEFVAFLDIENPTIPLEMQEQMSQSTIQYFRDLPQKVEELVDGFHQLESIVKERGPTREPYIRWKESEQHMMFLRSRLYELVERQQDLQLTREQSNHSAYIEHKVRSILFGGYKATVYSSWSNVQDSTLKEIVQQLLKPALQNDLSAVSLLALLRAAVECKDQDHSLDDWPSRHRFEMGWEEGRKWVCLPLLVHAALSTLQEHSQRKVEVFFGSHRPLQQGNAPQLRSDVQLIPSKVLARTGRRNRCFCTGVYDPRHRSGERNPCCDWFLAQSGCLQ